MCLIPLCPSLKPISGPLLLWGIVTPMPPKPTWSACFLSVSLGPRLTSVAVKAAPACLQLPKATLPPPQDSCTRCSSAWSALLHLLPDILRPQSMCPQTQLNRSPLPRLCSTTDLPIAAKSQCNCTFVCVAIWLMPLLPESRDLVCFHSLLYSQCLVPCLAQGKSPISICRVGEANPESSMGAKLP